MRPRVISLCCGAGVGEVGFSRRWDTVLAVDNWFRALCSFTSNFPRVPTALGGVEERNLLAWAVKSCRSVDGIVASTPCPSFSRANSGGTAAKAADPRSSLYIEPINWVQAFKPKFCVFENVDSIRTSPILGMAVDRLQKLGYNVVCWVLDAADYGTPQHRARLFLVATRGPIPTPPRPTHGRGKGLKPYKTIGDAIGGLTEEEALSMGCEKLSAVRKWIMEGVGPGQNWKALRGDRLAMAMRYARGGSGRLCRRYAHEEVASTLMTGPSVLGTNAPIHPGTTMHYRELARMAEGDVSGPPHDNLHQPHPNVKMDYRQFARYSPNDIADTLTVQRDQFKRIHPGRKISSELYARLDDKRSSPTLAAGGPVRQRRVQINPTVTRPLSVLEFLRLQGVTGKFVLLGSRGDKYRQAGNGIPVELAENVARAVTASL